MKPSLSLRRNETGFALFAALIFMISLTVLAVTVLRSSTLGERIAGNDLDRARAYQAAEATIRDAQRDILQVKPDGTSCIGQSFCRSSDLLPSKDRGYTDLTTVGCDNGMCNIDLAVMQAAGNVGPWDPSHAMNANFAQYGQFTSAPWAQLSTSIGSGVQLAQRPRYWVEILKTNPTRYRITATAWGVNANTVVTLQEIYQPFDDS